MPASRIRAIVGLHKISEYNPEHIDNTNNQNAYAIDFQNIIVHPMYECQRTENDIGEYLYSIKESGIHSEFIV